MTDTDNMTLDELRQLVESNGSVAKYADMFKQLEAMEQKTAELHKANEELRATLEESRKSRQSEEALYEIRDYLRIKSEAKRMTKDEIMAVKDTSKRLKLIRENMDLFQNEPQEKTASQKAQEEQYWYQLSKYGITKDNISVMTANDIMARMPKSGMARQFAISIAISEERKHKHGTDNRA